MRFSVFVSYVPTGEVLYNEVVNSKDYPGQENTSFEQVEELFKSSTSYLTLQMHDRWKTSLILREEVVKNCVIKLSKLED